MSRSPELTVAVAVAFSFELDCKGDPKDGTKKHPRAIRHKIYGEGDDVYPKIYAIYFRYVVSSNYTIIVL